MNSLASSFRTALRAQPLRTYTLATRPYSAAASPATPEPSSAPESSSASPSSSAPPKPSPLDAVLNDIAASKPTPRRAAPQSVADAYASKGPAHRLAFNDFLSSTPSSGLPGNPRGAVRPATPEELWRRQQAVNYSATVTTTSARSIPVVNRNVAQAYRNLNRVLQENNVRRELKQQERFEGPSNRRVRLNSERHRRRFKVAVGKAVALAMRMKDQ
ncbi:hypothetical protein JCM10207_008034 [Rhodosporidiobolus poonsookiae]